MSHQVQLLFAVLFVANAVFVWRWVVSSRTYEGRRRPSWDEFALGAVVAFFDTLGIGSFAPTAAYLKFRGSVPDEQIPGTLNIGTNIAAMLEMLIMVSTITVDPWLLMCSVLAAAAGAYCGAGVVNRLPRRAIQFVLGLALLIAGGVFAATNLHWLPGGGEAQTLIGWRFGLAVGVNFVLGSLMSVGVGLYAPCMIVVTLLGLHPRSAFPIMMGSCGLVQPMAGLQFFKSGRYGLGASLGLTVGAVPGVLLAAYVVRQLNLTALRWLVVGVVVYAALSMLRSFATARAAPPVLTPTAVRP